MAIHASEGLHQIISVARSMTCRAVCIWAAFIVVSRLGVSTSLTRWDVAAIRFAVAGVCLLPYLLKRGLALDRLGWIGLAAIAIGCGAQMVRRFFSPGPRDVRDGRRLIVGWFEALDDWGENVALTRSRHLIDGNLSLDGFHSGWMAAMAALGHFETHAAQQTTAFRAT